MYREILAQSQIGILPLVKTFYKDFGLVGGTAIALYLGHRRSIDFDLFSYENFSSEKLLTKIKAKHNIQTIFIDRQDELTLVVNNVKITFYRYPYKINYFDAFEDVIKMPDLLTLSAMKAFALGRRAKWKDYVDIFFVLKTHTFGEICNKTREIFGSEFNERLFREQLSYYEDVDYTEQVEYMPGQDVPDNDIKNMLCELSLK